MEDAAVRAYDALAEHPRIADLAALTHAWMQDARPAARGAPAEEADRDRPRPRLADRAAEVGLTRDDTGTAFGNAFDVLERGPEDDAERALACALAAHAVAAHQPADREAAERMAADLIWLAARTPFDATDLLDRALGEGASRLWDAVADRIRRVDQGKLPSFGRGEALVAAAALASARGGGARAAALGAEVRDPKLQRVLMPKAVVGSPEAVTGEATPAPHGPVLTALLAVTGILLVLRAARLIGRVVLAYKRPAEIHLSADGGVRVRWRTELLGRTLRDRDVLVPRSALLRATREVRYPRLALYAGLVALAAGSYFGMAAFVDGVRVASPSLLGAGFAIVGLGLALDLVLSSIAPGGRSQCRIVFVPSRGATLCVGAVDVGRADALLARLART